MGVKRPGRGVDNPPLSSAEVKERVELWAFVGCYRVTFTLIILLFTAVNAVAYLSRYLYIVPNSMKSVFFAV